MADEVELERGVLLQRADGLELLQQLLAADLGGVGARHLRHVHLGARGGQPAGDVVEVVDAQQVVEAQQAVDQHDRVFGLRRVGGDAGLDARGAVAGGGTRWWRVNREGRGGQEAAAQGHGAHRGGCMLQPDIPLPGHRRTPLRLVKNTNVRSETVGAFC
ncbi:hypothetical protein D9M70_510600 [compost metagenome]